MFVDQRVYGRIFEWQLVSQHPVGDNAEGILIRASVEFGSLTLFRTDVVRRADNLARSRELGSC